LALRERHASHVGEKAKLLTKTRLVDAAEIRPMAIADGAIRRPKACPTWRLKMKCLITLALAALVAPAAVAAQPRPSIAVSCDAGAAAPGGEASNLHGHWDFLMVPGGTPSFGLMSIGFVGADYGGSLAPVRTAPVVLRKITLAGNRIHMVVASTEGDVLFDGRLSAKGDYMCGTVTYHGGETFPMVAQKRPSTYQSQPQAQRGR
jgi:hypothetical protein